MRCCAQSAIVEDEVMRFAPIECDGISNVGVFGFYCGSAMDVHSTVLELAIFKRNHRSVLWLSKAKTILFAAASRRSVYTRKRVV